MQTFFRDEMIVTDRRQSIPSHEKLFRLISRLRQRSDFEVENDFAAPALQQWNEIHDGGYVRLVFGQDIATFDAASVPASALMVDSIKYASGSMLAAAAAAIGSGCSFSPTAGFHHAHWSRPGPFCLLNALPLTALHALNSLHVGNVLILDCDYHRGDGTEDILARLDDNRICHESLGFRFAHRSQSKSYLEECRRICRLIEQRRFGLVIYQAGMDVLVGDPAGGGLLTPAETRQRDSMVFTACHRHATPVVWNLAGGYQLPMGDGHDDVVEGHLNTYDCAIETFG